MSADTRAPPALEGSNPPMVLDEIDLTHLGACVELARLALEAGDDPFGSVLVDAARNVLFADRNRVGDGVGGDETRHPELAIVTWSVDHLDADQRRAATVYTSGEHCPMCSAAHGWVGLGRIVYAVSSSRLTQWREEWGAPVSPVAALPIEAVVPGVLVDGPAPELEDVMRELHRRRLAG